MHPSSSPALAQPAPAVWPAPITRQGLPHWRTPYGPVLTLLRQPVTAEGESAGAKQHLVFISRGRGHIELARSGKWVRRELAAGAVAVCPAGLPIRWSWPTPLGSTVLAIDPAFLDQVAGQIYGAAPGDFELLPVECEHDFGVGAVLDTLVHEASRAGLDRNLYLESLANVLAAHLLRHYSRWERGGPRRLPSEQRLEVEGAVHVPEPVQRAVRYIDEHHARDIGLRDIAKAANYSPFHLARLFKRSMGVPPHQYLIQARVRRAHALLSMGTGSTSLAEVAAACGFADQSHLTRHYKRVLGVTPGRVRRRTSSRSANRLHGSHDRLAAFE